MLLLLYLILFRSHLLSTNGYPCFLYPPRGLASPICSFKRVQRSKLSGIHLGLKWSLPIPWICTHKHILYTYSNNINYHSICRRRSQGIWNYNITTQNWNILKPYVVTSTGGSRIHLPTKSPPPMLPKTIGTANLGGSAWRWHAETGTHPRLRICIDEAQRHVDRMYYQKQPRLDRQIKPL